MQELNKVLVVTAARTGGTVLTDAFGVSIGTEYVYQEKYQYLEPVDKSTYAIPGKTAIKTAVGHLPSNWPSDEVWIEWLSTLFDRVIYMGRKDVVAQAESLSYARWRMKQNMKEGTNHQWHVPYFSEMEADEMNLKHCQRDLDKIKLLADRANQEVFWYEDIYNIDKNIRDKVHTKMGLDITNNKVVEMLDPVNKYRKSSRLSSI